MPSIFSSILINGLTVENYLICTACAFLCGVIAALAVSFRARISKSFLISIVILPAIVETVIIMVNGSVGTGIAVAGAFSLVRFRSVPGKAKEIAALFLAMTAGLSCAIGYTSIALLFTILASLVIVIVTLIPVAAEREMDLRITVPESLNYTDSFDDVFKKYTKKCRLAQVRTSNMGSLYRLDYKLVMNDSKQSRDMLDELRCRNGNLEIRISEAAERIEEL